MALPPEIDVTNAAPILERLLSVLDREPMTMIIDMTATTFCDSAGVNALLRTCKHARAQQAAVRLVVPALAVRRLFTITGLDRMLDVYPSLSAALAADRPTAASGTAPLDPGQGEPGSPAGTAGPPGP